MKIDTKKKRIVAFVITYYADEGLLLNNLNAFINDVDKVVIWDNTPNGDENVRRIAEQHVDIEYQTERRNAGISYALNKAWHYLEENEFEYLLTMDQDSRWQHFKQFIQLALASDAPHGIYGPEVRPKCINNNTFEQTDYVITSGMLISADILHLVKGYREDFFVDGIDLEFCLRAKKLGISTYRLCNCLMVQRFGTPKTSTILGHQNHTLNYSAQRLEGIVKNHLIILRNYPCSFSLRKKIVMTYFWKLPLKLLFLESGKLDKFKAFYRGIKEGLT